MESRSDTYLKNSGTMTSALRQRQRTDMLKYVPEELRSYYVCLAAVKADCYALEYVPIEHRDRNMCIAAVKPRGSALEYVPKELREEVKLMARL